MSGATFPIVRVRERVVISLSDQMAYLYRGSTLMAATTISSGRDSKPTPTGIFNIFRKTEMYRSKKYDNAPMPYAEFFDPARNRASRRVRRYGRKPRLRPSSRRVREKTLFGDRPRDTGLHRRVAAEGSRRVSGAAPLFPCS